jgi:hypothetical protein
MTDAARASEAMNAVSFEARHSDDSILELAARVAGPMERGRREAGAAPPTPSPTARCSSSTARTVPLSPPRPRWTG